MKKTFIILTLILPFLNTVQAFIPSQESALFDKTKNIKMPEFSVVDMNGKTHNQDTTKGKYLVVNFWATWCPPCLKEIPAFVEFYEKHSNNVEILGMNYEGVDVNKITDFTDTYMVNYPIILADNKNQVAFTKFGEIVGMPTTYVYAPNGLLVDYFMGEVSIKTLEKSITKSSNLND